jgi:hypothetical protein
MLNAQQDSDQRGILVSVQLTRLTKNLAAAMAAGAAMLAMSSSSAQASCVPSADQDRRATIALQYADLEGPVYYWHDSSTYALLYFRPEDLVARLESLLANEQGPNRDSIFGDASLAPALLDNIKVDLPLKESTDLFRYTLIDQRFDSVVNLVIADLMKEGKVMLDRWVLVELPAKSIVMVSRTDADGEEGGRWFCTASNDVLFKTGLTAFD